MISKYNRKVTAVLLSLVFILAACAVSFSVVKVNALVLKVGSSGDNVRKVQEKLKQYGYYTIAVDGIYGSGTREAVKKFQRANGLTVDGVVGKNTLNALGLGQLAGGSTNSGYNNSDLYLLAKCIHAESRGEPYVGQVAVGAVILNRVDSKNFPNSVSGVIYQPGAFTAVIDGQMNLEPNEESKRAAQDALNGWDPSYGALYYYNPAVATSSWIFSRKTITTIGKHIFAI